MRLYLNNLPMTLPRGFVLSLQRNNPLYNDRGSVAFNVEIMPNTDEARRLLGGATFAEGKTPRLVVPFKLFIPETGLQTLTGTATLTDVDDSGARFKLEADRTGLAFAAGTDTEDVEAIAGSEKYLDELPFDKTMRVTKFESFTTHTKTVPYPSCYVGAEDGTGLPTDTESAEYILQTEGEYEGVRARVAGDGSINEVNERVQVRLPYVLEQVLLKATGYTLPKAQNAMRFHPAHSRLFMVNARDTTNLRYMLPHWTVLEFIQEIRRVLGLVLHFNGETFTTVYVNTENGAETFFHDATNELQELNPTLPRSYEVSNDGTDDDGIPFTEQLDPTLANVGYEFLTDPTAREVLPDYVKEAAQTYRNDVRAREWYAMAHDGLGAYEIDGVTPLMSETAVSMISLYQNTNGYNAIPSNSTESVPYRTFVPLPTGGSVTRTQPFSIAKQSPVTTYGRYIGTNRDTDESNPTNTNVLQTECDYLAPMYRHDTASAKTDYNLRITPARIVVLDGDKIATHESGNTLHPCILTGIGTAGSFFEVIRKGLPELYPYIEERDTYTETDPDGAELDEYEKPSAPDGIEIFVI